jgi:hypothetical protein
MSIEKPEFLYHGSPNKKIEKIEPKKKFFRSVDEGPKVFAGAADIASMFLNKFGDSMTQIGTHNSVPCIIIRDRNHFLKRDSGGAIYKLDSEKFENDPARPFGKHEWTSDAVIEPIDKEEFESSLTAMLQKGVQVYFVDKKTFYKYKYTEKGEDRCDILHNMQSENEKGGINVRNF